MGYDDLFEPAKALEDAAKAGDAGAAAQVLTQLHGLVRRIQLTSLPAQTVEAPS